jgi:hypothetical protein
MFFRIDGLCPSSSALQPSRSYSLAFISVNVMRWIDYTWVLNLFDSYNSTISKDYALTVLNASLITVGYTRSSRSVTVFTSRCFVAASNCGRSPFPGFSYCHRPQLPASHSTAHSN